MKTAIFALFFLASTVADAADQIVLYNGKSVPNAAQHNGESTESYGAEIERQWADSLHYSIGYFNYGTMQVAPHISVKEDLFSLQSVYPIFLTKRFSVTFQGGPALLDTTQIYSQNIYTTGSYSDNTHLVLVHGFSLSYSISAKISLIGTMQRIDFTRYTSDGLLIGLKFSPL